MKEIIKNGLVIKNNIYNCCKKHYLLSSSDFNIDVNGENLKKHGVDSKNIKSIKIFIEDGNVACGEIEIYKISRGKIVHKNNAPVTFKISVPISNLSVNFMDAILKDKKEKKKMIENFANVV